MKSNELYHHGILGMKWGVRRYQNADGSLTAAGKKRYERDARENNWEIGADGIARSRSKKRKGEIHEADANKWVTEDLERSRGLANNTRQSITDVQNLNKATTKIQNKYTKRMDLSKMTDQEMRNQINRAILEQQYDDMFNPKKVRRGRETVNDILEIAGPVVGITSSALAIALSIKQLKG